MFQMLSIIVLLGAAILTFVSDPWTGWIICGALNCFLILQFVYAKKRYRFNEILVLSPAANCMLQKYSHYFALPLASRDLSAAAATSQIAGLALAAVGGFIEFWWGILFAIINWIIMGISAVKISPISLISSSIEAEIANEEVLSFLEAKRSQRRKEQSRNQSE